MKKTVTPMTDRYVVMLTRREIEKLKQISDKFESENLFEISQSSSSGIGSTTQVTVINEEIPFTADITDFDSW